MYSNGVSTSTDYPVARAETGRRVTIPGFQRTKRIDGPPAIAQRRRSSQDGHEQRMCRFESLEIRRMQKRFIEGCLTVQIGADRNLAVVILDRHFFT
jgi:hypothetical protein